VISGHIEALEVAEKLALGRGALKAARLAVSGAFHTPLMEPARLALLEVLGQVGGASRACMPTALASFICRLLRCPFSARS
jgi:malonyl CoA-acyl carrier protein transacylase